MYNYIEMRDLVTKRSFLVRKKLDNLLHWLFPNWWVPLYTSVTFSRMRYHQCVLNRKWQDDLLTSAGKWSLRAGLLALFLVSFS
jgi:kynurenine 3-monooxygenase